MDVLWIESYSVSAIRVKARMRSKANVGDLGSKSLLE